MSIDRVAEIEGVGRFRAGSYFEGTTNDPAGSASVTRIVVANTLNALASTGYLCGTTSGSGNNWGVRVLTSASSVRFRFADGGGSFRFDDLPVADVVRPDALWIFGCSYGSGGGLIELRASNGLSSSKGPYAGFTELAVTKMRIGSAPATPSADSHGTVAVLGSDTVALDQAGLAAAIASVKQDLEQGRDPAVAAGYDEFLWQAKNIDWVNGEWTDEIAGIVLSQVGNPERVSVPARVL